MADKQVSELSSVSTITDGIELVVEDGSEAKKTSVGALTEYIKDQLGSENSGFKVIIYSNGSITEAQTIADIADAAVDGIPVFLFVDTYSNGVYFAEVYALVAVRYNEYQPTVNAYADFRKASGTINDSYYRLTSDGTLTLVDNSASATIDKNITISAAHTLTLETQPSEDNHVATKKYVDDSVGAVTGAVYSVNNMTGDVEIVIPVTAVINAPDRGYVIEYINGSITYSAIVPDMTAYPLIATYNVASQYFSSNFLDIKQAWNAGRPVYCDISCGNSTFRAELKRHHDAAGGYSEHFSFEYTVYQVDDSELWFGRVTVNSSDNVSYSENLIRLV